MEVILQKQQALQPKRLAEFLLETSSGDFVHEMAAWEVHQLEFSLTYIFNSAKSG